MKKDKVKHKCSIIVNEKWKLLYRIGSGSFGETYEAINESTGKRFAVKLENADKKKLYSEFKCYKMFRDIKGIPQVFFFGPLYEYQCLVLELLGPSLEDLFNFCHRRFSLKTVCLLADQMLEIIENVHKKAFIHRDIKPANFLMGIAENFNKLYLIDFGLSKMYMDKNIHVQFRDNRNLTGTPRYVSINTHNHCEQSRRDDLESIGYLLIYFLNGSLPWQGIKAKSKLHKYEKIAELKISSQVDNMLFKNIPPEFKTYLNECRSLSFEATPDYKHLRGLFSEIAKRQNFNFDYVYDWNSKYLLNNNNNITLVK